MERGRGFPWDMLESVVCWGVAGAGARNGVVGSQGSRGGRSPECNGSIDGEGATWWQSRKQMRAGGTQKDACESIPSESSARLEASQNPGKWRRESVAVLRAGMGKERRSRVGGWKRNSRMLVSKLL